MVTLKHVKTAYMGCHAVLLQKGFLQERFECERSDQGLGVSDSYLCEMKLQWVISAQADVESSFEEIGKRVALVRQKQCVVA